MLSKMIDYKIVDSEESFKPSIIDEYKAPEDVVATVKNSMGYTDRAINQKKQVRNTYLDSCTFEWQRSVTSTNTLELTTSVSYTTVWWYDFTRASWFVIPADWTYIITVSTFMATSTPATSWVFYWRIYHTLSNLTTVVNSVDIAIPRESCNWNWNTGVYTYAFNKWDVVRFYWDNQTDQTATIVITATITKLS